MTKHWRRFVWGVAMAALAMTWGQSAAQAQALWLTNPDWEINLTNFGYSDLLFDRTPGFEGREYLSGEWATAIGFDGIDDDPCTFSDKAEWLEPHFIFPDWTTNSRYSVVTPIHYTGPNADGLPTASSTVSNGILEVTKMFEMIDTETGIAMGSTPKDSPGPGSAVTSNRYVLVEKTAIKNVSGVQLTNLTLTQFLHGLQSQQSLFDDRHYPGLPLDGYHYDTTQRGQSPTFFFPDGGGGLADIIEIIPEAELFHDDIIGFHSAVAPDAYDNHYFGQDPNDNHSVGKPGIGTHLNIEAGALNMLSEFDPNEFWVGGAQQWVFDTLDPGETIDHDVLLTISTGISTPHGDDIFTFGNGGVGNNPDGGVDVVFDSVTAAGTFKVTYSDDANDIASGLSGLPTSPIDPADLRFIWDLDFTGTFDGNATVTVAFPFYIDVTDVLLAHFDGVAWETLTPIDIDTILNTITFELDSFSPIVATPEPTAAMLMGLAGLAMVVRRRRAG